MKEQQQQLNELEKNKQTLETKLSKSRVRYIFFGELFMFTFTLQDEETKHTGGLEEKQNQLDNINKEITELKEKQRRCDEQMNEMRKEVNKR